MSSTPQHKSHISNVLCQAVTSAHWLIPTPASRYWKMISRTNVILIVFILGPRYWQQLTNLHRIYWKSVGSVQGIIFDIGGSLVNRKSESWVLSCRRQINTSIAIIPTLFHIPAPKVCTVVYRCNVSTVAGMGNSVSPSGTRLQSPLGHGANQQHSVGREAPALTHHITL